MAVLVDDERVAAPNATSTALDLLSLRTNALVAGVELATNHLRIGHIVVNETPSGPEPGHLDQFPAPTR